MDQPTILKRKHISNIYIVWFHRSLVLGIGIASCQTFRSSSVSLSFYLLYLYLSQFSGYRYPLVSNAICGGHSTTEPYLVLLIYSPTSLRTTTDILFTAMLSHLNPTFPSRIARCDSLTTENLLDIIHTIDNTKRSRINLG